jgi:hypothetical protein
VGNKRRERKRRLREKRVKRKLAARRQRLRAERQARVLEDAKAEEIGRKAAELHALIPPETIEVPQLPASSDCPAKGAIS